MKTIGSRPDDGPTPPASALGSGGVGSPSVIVPSCLVDSLRLDLDVDLLGHDQAAGLHDRTEGHSEVVPVDLGPGAESDPMVAVGVLDHAFDGHVEDDGPGGAP